MSQFNDCTARELQLLTTLGKHQHRRRTALLNQLWDEATLEFVDSLEQVLTDDTPEQLKLRSRLSGQRAETLNRLAQNAGLFTWANQRALLAIRLFNREG